MRKIYFVDSENVGDVWVPLLIAAQEGEEVVVFYTQRSPYMSYESVRKLKETEKEPIFIKCFEGNNALDFQLVSELGYRLCGDPDCEYVIVSNDTGFDAVVRYWRGRKRPVSRLNGKDCQRILRGGKWPERTAGQDKAAPTEEPQESVLEEAVITPEIANVTDAVAMAMPDPENEAAVCETEPCGPEPGAGAAEEPCVAEELEAGEAEVVFEADEAVEPEAEMEAEPAFEADEAGEAEPVAQGLTEAATQEEPASAGEMEQAQEAEPTPTEEPSAAENEASPAEGHRLALESPEVAESVVTTLLGCIGKENLPDYHNALILFFGTEKGKEIYAVTKADPKFATYRAALSQTSQKEKFASYCHIIFLASGNAEEEPKDFAAFLYQSADKRKNLNSLRAALTGHYGKDKGMKYYSLFKSHIKIMNRMQ